MSDYSQAGQDKFVLSLINDKEKHFFLDIGCWLPTELNNTYLLENFGWDGISIDITNLKTEWNSRNTKFVCDNALTMNYQNLFDSNNTPMVIDYLNLDIEGNGDRFNVLKKVLETNRTFKIITIEHDKYRGFETTEKIPQVSLLSSLGYELVCDDVCLGGNPFEDWWVNPKFIERTKYEKLISKNKEANEIIKLL